MLGLMFRNNYMGTRIRLRNWFTLLHNILLTTGLRNATLDTSGIMSHLLQSRFVNKYSFISHQSSNYSKQWYSDLFISIIYCLVNSVNILFTKLFGGIKCIWIHFTITIMINIWILNFLDIYIYKIYVYIYKVYFILWKYISQDL